MANFIKISLIVTCMVLILTGCSGNSGPSTPGIESDPSNFTNPISDRNATEAADNHVLLLYNLIYIDTTDPDSIEYEIVPLRASSMHLNILKFLEVGPCTNCFKLVGINFPEPGVLNVDIEITHPFPSLDFTIFDVRGIMLFNASHVFPASDLTMSDSSMGDGELLNAQGFTQLYNGSTLGMAGDLFTYFKGKLATPTVPNADLNGFIRHRTDHPVNTRNALYPADSVTHTYSLAVPAGEWVFGYAVDASWDIPSMPVIDPMTDFPETANCIEPWKVVASSDTINGNGSTTLTIDVYDWQGKDTISEVLVECPELYTGQVTATFLQDGSGFTRYEAVISNDDGAQEGSYKALISAEAIENASSPDWADLTAYRIHNIDITAPISNGNLVWAKRAGGTEYDYANGITTLSDDSTVVTGGFSGTAIFGEGEPAQTVLVSGLYGDDLFVARYNPDGTLAWAKRAGGPPASGNAITTLSDDSTVVTGIFSNYATFGEGEINETELVSEGGDDFFVARYNPDGTLAWAKRAGGMSYDCSYGITTLSEDSTIVTGEFEGSATFGKGESAETVLVSDGNSDIFVARYNPDGTIAWAKRSGGTGTNYSSGITSLSDDSSIVTGRFRSSATFGKFEVNETVLVSDGFTDIFVARYNPDGTIAWAKRAGGTRYDFGYGITTLSDDSTIVTGVFEGAATFGDGETNETVLISDGGVKNDIFVARFNPDGTLAWVKQAGGTSDDNGIGITTLSDDSTVVTGDFADFAIFGEGETYETILVSDGGVNHDIFVARYNPDGTLVWANRAGGTLIDYSREITTLSNNSTVVTGVFVGSATFGENEPNEAVLISHGNSDIFIARFMP